MLYIGVERNCLFFLLFMKLYNLSAQQLCVEFAKEGQIESRLSIGRSAFSIKFNSSDHKISIKGLTK